ncbi:MAG: bifunctional phosphoribosylaminoimidazolecarboxamide formyltransferase/IMP cyclohydrolase [Gemmatimonadales bacterium]|jgi:phosphoribosylaminoimidazolecarboxamide formyltransferase/IMP cyclohydrolase
MPYALLSVSDKTGIEDLGARLVERGYQILSTGGTAQALRKAGVEVASVSDFTGFPEILGGRVKTLHPAIHAGLLARTSVEADVEELEELGLSPIDLVAVNLYPFRETVARPETMFAEALEQIDIGGPTMLRAAAKNHPFVWPVCDPGSYDEVIAAIDAGGEQLDLRRRLAAQVFEHTAAYDAAIAGYLDRFERTDRSPAGAGEWPDELLLSLVKVQSLRYGENPDQPAAFYRSGADAPYGIPGLRQLHGKELSYNNLLDVDGALLAIAPWLDEDQPACAILKHTTPCGIAVGNTLTDAYRKALACDPVSAFGSTVVFSQPVTEGVAEELAGLFVECLVAPGCADSALKILQRKQNIRILLPEDGERLRPPAGHVAAGVDLRGVSGGVLVQAPPSPARPSEFRASAEVMTDREPTDAEWANLAFAWGAVQSVKSNAILLARDGASIGIGAGQMSRVDAVKIARMKAEAAGLTTGDCVLASDAFFPFRDGLDAAAEAGATAVVQPAGSKRDEEVVAAANEHGIAMVATGRRTFRH